MKHERSHSQIMDHEHGIRAEETLFIGQHASIELVEYRKELDKRKDSER